MPQEPAGDGVEEVPDSGVSGTVLRVTRTLALCGGALLLAATAVTVASVAGRYAFGLPVPGDYELVELLCAVAVFLFFPFTHATDSNITAEFFTSALSPRYRRALDVTHDVIFTLIAALLTWRLGHGLENKFTSGEATILIRIPLWWAYCFAVLSMALLTLVCLWRVARGLGMLRR